MLNFVIFFLDREKSNTKFLSHMFQYSKILESPNKHNVMTSFGIRLINSSIGYNLSVVVDSCITKALVDCECYVILFVCYKGVTKSFSS